MRGPAVSVLLALGILGLLGGLGLWLFHSGREAAVDAAREDAASADDAAAEPRAGPSGAGAAEDETVADEAETGAAVAADAGSELPVSIEGRISDAGGAPVEGARVMAVERQAVTDIIERGQKLLDSAPLAGLRSFQASLAALAKRLPAGTSGPDGAYALRGLPAGDHRVFVSHREFLRHVGSEWILVTAGSTARYDVELLAGSTIAGRARDAAGASVAGATVRASRVETSRLTGLAQLFQLFIEQTEGTVLIDDGPAVTDETGAFRLTSLEPGAYDLRLVKEGFARGEARDVLAGAEDITVTLEPAIRVAGRVVAAGRRPLAGASVILREPERDLKGPGGPLALAMVSVDVFGEKERAAATDIEGRFSLAALARGSYDLVVGAPGFPEHRRPVELEEGPLELGDIVIAPGLEIAGTVLSPEGLPVADAAVWVPAPASPREDREERRRTVLEAGPAASLASTRTEPHGSFRLEGLAGTRHELAVLADGYPGQLLEGVVAGSRGVAVALERGVSVRGRVVDAESGEAVADARVAVEGASALEEAVDAEGRFELRGLDPGRGASFGQSLVVRASCAGYREASETVAIADGAMVADDVVIPMRRPGPEELQEGITGVVRDAGGAPLASALVWTEVPGWPQVLRHMEGRGALPREVRTGTDGTFRLQPPVIGGTTFEVVASSPGLAVSRAGPFPQNELPWPHVELRLGPGAAVEGRVTGPSGAAVAGARVRLWRDTQVPEQATLFTQLLPQAVGEVTYAAADGSYRLRRIEPGTCWLEARAPGHAARPVGPVEVVAGTVPTRVDIVLGTGGSLAGRVVDAGGEPLGGVEVVALVAAAGAAASGDENELLETGALGAGAALSGRDGTFRIDHLPDGPYRVLARTRGFEQASTAASVPGEPLADLVLAPHARLAGSVRDAATGEPIPGFALRLERREPDGYFREDGRQGRDVEDVAGRFACESLRAGEWRLRVLAPSHLPWARELTLAPGDQVDLDVAPESGRRIDGVVRRADGGPVAGAAVSLRRQAEGRELGSTRSGDDGAFAFAGLEDAAYELQAAHPEHFAEPAEGTAKVQLAGADVEVRLQLRPAGKVLGRVRGLVFRPPGWDIFVVNFTPIAGAPAHASFHAWADATGTIRIDSVRPGTYRVELTHRRRAADTGDEWISVPPETRPLGELEVRAGELASFEREPG